MRPLFFVLFFTACGPNLPPEIHLYPEPDAGVDAGQPDPVVDAGPPDSGAPTPDAGAPYCSHPALRVLEVDQRCDCARARGNVDLAIAKLVGRGVIPRAKLDMILSTISVRVLWDPDNKLGGVYYTSKQIEISSSMDGMAHEFIHAIEDYHGVVDWSDPHKGWDSNSAYMGAMQDYIWNHQAVMCTR